MGPRARTSALATMAVVAGLVLGGTGVVVMTGQPTAIGGRATGAPLPTNPAGRAPDAAQKGTPSSRASTAPSTAPTTTTTTAVTTTVTPPPVTTTLVVPEETTPTATVPPASTPQRPSEVDVPNNATLEQDVAAAIQVTEAYWNDVFTGWNVTWIGPQVWNGDGFYDSAVGDGPICAGEVIEMNASYCGYGTPGEGFVSWDRQLLEPGYEALGDAFPYLVIAHEWAHAAQERFIADGEAPAVLEQQELQADCLAGATLAGAVERGYLTLEPGDTDELALALEVMGDTHAWTGPDDHGSSAERIAWFSDGFKGDIESCLGNADGTPRGSGH